MKKVKPYEVGTRVEWNWMGRKVHGAIQSIYLRPIKKTLRGTRYVRNGSPEHPAYFIKAKSGNGILKLHRELTLRKTSSARR